MSPSEQIHKLEAEISDLKRRLNTIEHNAQVHMLKHHKLSEVIDQSIPSGLISDEI